VSRDVMFGKEKPSSEKGGAFGAKNGRTHKTSLLGKGGPGGKGAALEKASLTGKSGPRRTNTKMLRFDKRRVTYLRKSRP